MTQEVSEASEASNASQLTVILFNARSILRKWPTICREIDAYQPSVVAITETWLCEDITKYYTYHDYQQFFRGRPNGGGGGVALYFSQAWSVTEANLPTSSPPSCEVLQVVEKVTGHYWVLVYRPPGVSAGDTRQLSRALSALLTLHPQATIFGDLYYAKIAWLPHSKSTKPVADDNLSFEFLEEIWASWDLEQLVHYPSRKNSYLDIILIINVDNFSSVDMFPPVSTSDHQLILCRWQCTERCREPATRRPNFNKADYRAMSTVLASVNWPQIFSECSTVNNYWLALYRVLKTVIRDFVPVTTCLSHRRSTRRQRVPHEVYAAIIHKRKVWRRWKATPSAENKALYNKASRDCSSSIRRHTANEEDTLLHMNQHSFYTCVSRQLHPASYGISLINDGNSLDSPLDIAQCFSAKFSKNFSIPACDEIAGIPTVCNGPKLDLINVDIGTVRKLLMQQRSSAAGPDGIPGLFYRKLAGVLAQRLATVFQQSIYQRAILGMW